MTVGFRRKLIKNQAEKIASEAGFTSLAIDPFKIAEIHEIVVEEMPPGAKKEASGMLVRAGDRFGILYSRHIENEGFRRFSVAHELGHYFLEGHPDAVLANGCHISDAGYASRDKYENEADQFAAALLLPEDAVKKALRETRHRFFNAVDHLSTLAKTSLTATAFRYAELTDEAVAVILSQGDTVVACIYSEKLKNLGRLGWLYNSALPAATATRDISTCAASVANGARKEDETDLSIWFGLPQRIRGLEQVCGLGSYGRTLTLLSCEVATDDDYDPEAEAVDEESLIRSWTPKFRR